MPVLHAYLRQWQANPLREILAGAVATFALIPEVIAFSFTAGIDPATGLYASFIISLVIAVFGGRPAMISAAAGSVALVVAPLVKEHGLEYLFAAGLLAGVFQLAFGFGRLSSLMRFVSNPVRTGFVNALAVLIFAAQLPHILSAGLLGWALIAFGLAIILVMPRVTTTVPAPLICVVVLTILAEVAGLPVARVADLGALPSGLPVFALPQVSLSFDLLKIIFLPALAIAMVGLLESLMTARVVDDLTNTASNPDAEARGLGLANIAASLFGGIAGCGMIGQTVSNVKYGGRGRLSTLAAGGLLLLLMVAMRDVIAAVPVAALVAIMILVSVDTFDWGALRRLHLMPRLSAVVMLITVAVTLATHNLSLGVLCGVLASAVFFTATLARSAQLQREGDLYRLTGPLFFASAPDLFAQIRESDHQAPVTLDLSAARLWDVTAREALAALEDRFAREGVTLIIRGEPHA
ncbi:SulP family inorganic anion transporter [Falsigemmobacter faecalis]|uniref:SulP family inorganic anion transporter n=1 Tax=Falsigemmobacter faecalis TaxID=2488730 RepID=A0A3P3DIS4_9RHOB|nr:SulP family inorganic anion transporter [Falsigemmobacter faecalis]RRH73492.1 SulP family inorganic anion transporter [Falsigemmobacter faecalis]